jgi:hypothetical protein
MPIDQVFEAFGSSLSRIKEATGGDLNRVLNELEQSQRALDKSTDPVSIWTAGISVASIQSESVSQINTKDMISLMKSASELPLPQKPKLLPKAISQPVRKAVTFNPEIKSVTIIAAENTKREVSVEPSTPPIVPETPQTATKVRNMLSVWEEKIQRVTTPHYGKTPISARESSADVPSGLKRKEPEKTQSEDKNILIPIPESPALDTSFDGPILEIPDDLLAELDGLEPDQREKRISVLKQEVEERRMSRALEEPRVEDSGSNLQQNLPAITGRVAAALKLFTGTTVPKRDFGVVSFAPSKAYSREAGLRGFQQAPQGMEIDGEAIEEVPQEPVVRQEPVKFYDAREGGVLDVEFVEESESEQNDPEISQLHAAKEVAEEEAAVEELEKSAWLADIEEIKIVSTPAKGRSEATADWSAVSQKMNLSCHLTPVVPGRRSCIVAKPKMLPLGPKHNADQYDITDKDTDSENEPSPNTRAKKHIPSWCTNWRQKAIAQIAVDPESIFGVTVPKCDLDVIFTEKNYRGMGLSRPARVRGSSGNWTFDKLTQEEVDRYRAKLGQVVKADGVFVEQ